MMIEPFDQARGDLATDNCKCWCAGLCREWRASWVGRPYAVHLTYSNRLFLIANTGVLFVVGFGLWTLMVGAISV
jgi:hypothetical protein